MYGLRGKRHAILANVSDAELVFAEDGSFEIILSAERPDGAANWLQLEPAAATLVTRQYFADWETETPARFNIEADGLASLFATPDNQCVGGWYQLAEDEALVMSGRAPTCRLGRTALEPRLESREFLHRSVCLNHSQVELEADGTFRIVVAHRDPGTPNWLDTAGHSEGGVVFRWLLPEGDLPRPTLAVERLPAS